MEKEPMMYIRWVDSCLQSSWVKAPSEETGLLYVETIGYLVYEDDEHIEIAQSKTEAHKSAIISIPISVIKERKELRMKK